MNRLGESTDVVSGLERVRHRGLRFAEVDHHRDLAETLRSNSEIGQSNREPDAANAFCKHIQIPPDQRAEDETYQRKQNIGEDHPAISLRSEERRVGKECRSRGRAARWRETA